MQGNQNFAGKDMCKRLRGIPLDVAHLSLTLRFAGSLGRFALRERVSHVWERERRERVLTLLEVAVFWGEDLLVEATALAGCLPPAALFFLGAGSW